MKTIGSKSEILERVKKVYNIKSNTELADYLGVSKSTLSNWYKRNSIDYDLLFSACSNSDLEYILTGSCTKSEDISIDEYNGINKKYIIENKLNPSEFHAMKETFGMHHLLTSLNKKHGYDSDYIPEHEIYLINELIGNYSLNIRFSYLYGSLKNNEISKDELMVEYKEMGAQYKELSTLISPYVDVINELYNKIVEFDMKHESFEGKSCL